MNINPSSIVEQLFSITSELQKL